MEDVSTNTTITIFISTCDYKILKTRYRVPNVEKYRWQGKCILPNAGVICVIDAITHGGAIIVDRLLCHDWLYSMYPHNVCSYWWPFVRGIHLRSVCMLLYVVKVPGYFFEIYVPTLENTQTASMSPKMSHGKSSNARLLFLFPITLQWWHIQEIKKNPKDSRMLYISMC